MGSEEESGSGAVMEEDSGENTSEEGDDAEVAVESIAVSPISADPDENNCAEQMHGSHPLGRIRALGQSAVVRTARCSFCDRPELRRLQYVEACLT